MPVADNIPGADMPKFRNLWEHIGKRMLRKGRAKAAALDPLSIPVELQTALEALYGHYVKVFDQWRAVGKEDLYTMQNDLETAAEAEVRFGELIGGALRAT